MGKILEKDEEMIELITKYQIAAANNAVNAFNEGYMLGMQHAESVFKDTVQKGGK